jgi:hypothetical protein
LGVQKMNMKHESSPDLASRNSERGLLCRQGGGLGPVKKARPGQDKARCSELAVGGLVKEVARPEWQSPGQPQIGSNRQQEDDQRGSSNGQQAPSREHVYCCLSGANV